MYRAFDRSQLKVLPLREREHLLDLSVFPSLSEPPPELPSEFEHALKRTAAKIREAKAAGRAVILSMGAHVIRRGLACHIVDLARRGFITHVATNGACAIHDFEFALIGATTESVAQYIREGQFGLWEETGRGVNLALREAAREGIGAGEALGRMIAEDLYGFSFPYKEKSLFAGLWRLGVPATVHIAIGQDIIHEHPSCDGAALGASSYRDFLVFTASMERLGGGVFMNFGSQVMGPEVYLKALAMVRNAAKQRGELIADFLVLNSDLVRLSDPHRVGTPDDPHYYYRPKKTLLVRSLERGCESYHVSADHRVSFLNLYRFLVGEGKAPGAQGGGEGENRGGS